MLVQTFTPSTLEAEEGRSLSSRPAKLTPWYAVSSKHLIYLFIVIVTIYTSYLHQQQIFSKTCCV